MQFLFNPVYKIILCNSMDSIWIQHSSELCLTHSKMFSLAVWSDLLKVPESRSKMVVPGSHDLVKMFDTTNVSIEGTKGVCSISLLAIVVFKC